MLNILDDDFGFFLVWTFICRVQENGYFLEVSFVSEFLDLGRWFLFFVVR